MDAWQVDEFKSRLFFGDKMKKATESTLKQLSNDYSIWIMHKSKGLIFNALNILSESVRSYVYLLLTSQVSARHSILQLPAAKQIYLDNLGDIINRQVDTAKVGIKTY